MLIAPHPDDEALACSVILQQAVRAGAAIRIVYVTDGDDNPWPQRALERRWSLSPSDRKRWGKLRRAEALAALRVLDIRPADVQFLALPDQGLTDLLLRDCDRALTRITRVIDDWSPTDILAPSLFDIHPDHNAVAVMMRLIFADFLPRISQWNYLVHGDSPAFFDRAAELSSSELETAKKREAIRCHHSEVLKNARTWRFQRRRTDVNSGKHWQRCYAFSLCNFLVRRFYEASDPNNLSCGFALGSNSEIAVRWAENL